MTMSSTTCTDEDLVTAARQAVERFGATSHMETAMLFLETIGNIEFISQSNDRLVKVGRNLVSLMDLNLSDVDLKASLVLLKEECALLLSDKVKVPKVRFGKTNVNISIVTLGCMRFQEEWGPRIDKLNMVGSDCQDNLAAILKRAIDFGINHIETARGYGCSELQLGCALKQLFVTKQVKREDLIIQTKVNANKDIKAFQDQIDTSLRNLQLDYVDLFSVHGMNFPEQMQHVFGDNNDNDAEFKNCWEVVQKYKNEGKIRHVGFSTHASTDMILECIKKDCFDYVNLHYHYFGSYTASGGGHDGNGNLDSIKALQERDMGVFIISPYDKGGRLYAPSRKLRSLTLPEMEPMSFGSHWIWKHHELYKGSPPLHTFTVGAARPADLDQPCVQAYLHSLNHDETLADLKTVFKRLEETKVQALGKDWIESWWKGLPKAAASTYHVEHNQIVWIYNNMKAFGMYEFGKARYNSFEKNGEKWDEKLPMDKNLDNVGRIAWGYVPGLPLKAGVNYDDDLKDVPEENKQRVREAEDFVIKWCSDPNIGKPEQVNVVANFLRKNFSVSSQLFKLPNVTNAEEAKQSTLEIPQEWKTSFDMRPWPDFPDQPSRKIGG